MAEKFRYSTLLKNGAADLKDSATIDDTYTAPPGTAQVFSTEDIRPDSLLKVYAKICSALTGKTAIKLHTGEHNGLNLLPVELIKALQPKIPDSAIVECKVAYGGPQEDTVWNRQIAKINGFDFCPVDIMDTNGDHILPIPEMYGFPRSHPEAYAGGLHLTDVAVGKNFMNYDSMLVHTLQRPSDSRFRRIP